MKSRSSIATVLALSVSLFSLSYATVVTGPVGGSVFIVECRAQYTNANDILHCVMAKCTAIHLNDTPGFEACMHNAGY